MNVSAPFIKRPIATSLLALAVLLSGMLAFQTLPVAPLPRVDFPTINVSASLPGASPETMASAVATPLERRLGRIAGVNEITSASTTGSTSITIQFDLARDVESAARDVQAAIAASTGDLPPNMPARPIYRKVNPADAPIMIVSLKSDSLPLSAVFDAANTVLAQKISQVKGVGQVFVGGGQQPAVRVQVDPAALAGAGLSMEDVRTAIAQATVSTPKGSVQDAQRMYVLGANDQLLGAAAYEKVIVKASGPHIVRLADVAKLVDGVENDRVAAWVNGTRSVLLIIRRQPGANILETNQLVRKILPELVTSVSPAIKTEIALDRTQSIQASVHDVEQTLVISIGLVVLVVFVFLRSLRATAIPGVAVPLSLVATFGIMYLCDYSLDNLSLMALTISTGFVVDDAIVVTENVARMIELGKTPMQAAFDGAKQIGFTIVSITVSLLAVFIPILLMGGVVGRLFREFAVTLGVAVAVSAVVSLTLTPMMASRWLAPHASFRQRGKLYTLSERFFDGLTRRYAAGLDFVLRHRITMTIVTFAMIALSVFLYVRVPKGLFPQQDVGMLMGFSEAPQDVSFASMKERQERINAVVNEDPDVSHAVSFIGGGPGGSGNNTGSVFIELKPFGQRKATADEVIARLRPKLGRIEGISLFLQAVQDVRLGGRGTRTQYQYALQSANLDDLRTWAPKVMDRLKAIPIIKDVATDQQNAGLQADITIDRDSAARLGVTLSDVDNTLYDAFGQRQIATNYTQRNSYRVIMEMKPESTRTLDALHHIYVRGNDGALVPLDAVSKVSASPVPLAVNHQGQFAAVTLSFNLAPGVALGQAVDAVHAVEADLGMPASVRASFQGTAQAFGDSLSSQPYLILAALIAVYIVLGVLYESYIHPITILSTLPSAGVGALIALMVWKSDLNVIALIGIILLIGIVKKNAIMMIDFAIEAERDEGKSPVEAIREACLLRFRPIMMTTLAALLGGLPLALATGAGAELRRPLGITIVGGLLVSQSLTLFTTPVIYLLMDRFAKKKSYRSPKTGDSVRVPATTAPSTP